MGDYEVQVILINVSTKRRSIPSLKNEEKRGGLRKLKLFFYLIIVKNVILELETTVFSFYLNF